MEDIITGFKVSIEIQCETEVEIVQHLNVLAKDLKKYLRKNPEINVVPVHFEDNNCYGDHSMLIDFDKR